jgi:hypothetical protein
MHKNDIAHRSDANAHRFAPTINFAVSVCWYARSFDRWTTLTRGPSSLRPS